MTPKPIVLLASVRSGTNLLTRMLGTDPNIDSVGESFLPNPEFRRGNRRNFWNYIESDPPPPLDVSDRMAQFGKYLEFLQSLHPDQRQLIDAKYSMIRQLDAGYVSPDDPPLFVQFARARKLPIIHLIRRNLLELHCSVTLALRTGRWVVRKGVDDPGEEAQTLRLDPRMVVAALEKQERNLAVARGWLAGYRNSIEIFYEDILADGRLSPHLTAEIGGLIGETLAPSPFPVTQKIAPPVEALIENFDEIAAVLRESRFAHFLPEGARRQARPLPASAAAPPLWENLRLEARDRTAAAIWSRDPLVTLSGSSPARLAIAGLMAAVPRMAEAPSALHFIHYKHNLEGPGLAEKAAAEVKAAAERFPGHVFVPLTASETEGYLLAGHGVPSLQAAGVIFLDETIWRVREPSIPGLGSFEACYVARLDPQKRHELAAGIGRLMLVYTKAITGRQEDQVERVRRLLPNAFFANDELEANGAAFEIGKVADLLAHCDVGLCLSASEGIMRAATEYMLCGLPVVSTRSKGGRDRYFVGDHCRIVEDDPAAIAAAVAELRAEPFDREAIRAHALDLLAFERNTFRIAAEKLARTVFGPRTRLPDFSRLIGSLERYNPVEAVAATLRAELDGTAQPAEAPAAPAVRRIARLKDRGATAARLRERTGRGRATILHGSELDLTARQIFGRASLADDPGMAGCDIVHAVRDVARAAQALGPDAAIVQAPAWPPHRQPGLPAAIAGHPDLLARIGFGDRRKLAAMVAAWSALIDLVEPDLVIAEASPALLLALYGSTMPVIAFGSPFAMPPLDYARFPPLRGVAPAIPEERLLQVARKVQSERLKARPASLLDIFRASARIVAGVPELDPYLAFRKEEVATPLEGLPEPQPWPAKRHLYVELGPDVADREAVVQALAAGGHSLEAFLPGDASGLADFLEMRGHVVHQRPPRLTEVMARASHVVSQADSVIAGGAFAAGRPQLVVLPNEEAGQVFRQLDKEKVVQFLDPRRAGDRLAATVERFVEDVTLSENAAEAAARLAIRPAPDGRLSLVSAIRPAVKAEAPCRHA